MYKKSSISLLTGILVLSVFISVSFLSLAFTYPFPPATISPMPHYVTLDLAGVVSGMRRITADIAWIQLLVYYGTPSEPEAKEYEYAQSWNVIKKYFGLKEQDSGHEDCHTPGCSQPEHHHEETMAISQTFPDVFVYCDRITRLDPFFDYVYLYGAGALAWNLDRPHEAIELLHKGIDAMERYRKDITNDHAQDYWQFHLYLGAIIYRKEGRFDQMVSSLELAVTQKNCPNIVKTILANIYQKEKKYPAALTLWLDVYESGDPSYRVRSSEKINELRKILGI